MAALLIPDVMRRYGRVAYDAQLVQANKHTGIDAQRSSMTTKHCEPQPGGLLIAVLRTARRPMTEGELNENIKTDNAHFGCFAPAMDSLTDSIEDVMKASFLCDCWALGIERFRRGQTAADTADNNSNTIPRIPLVTNRAMDIATEIRKTGERYNHSEVEIMARIAYIPYIQDEGHYTFFMWNMRRGNKYDARRLGQIPSLAGPPAS